MIDYILNHEYNQLEGGLCISYTVYSTRWRISVANTTKLTLGNTADMPLYVASFEIRCSYLLFYNSQVVHSIREIIPDLKPTSSDIGAVVLEYFLD